MWLAYWTTDNFYDYNDHKNTNVNNDENNENNNSHNDIDDYDKKDNPLQRISPYKTLHMPCCLFFNQF